MSPQVVKAEVGEYCVIEYFEHSKYIYSLYIENHRSYSGYISRISYLL